SRRVQGGIVIEWRLSISPVGTIVVRRAVGILVVAAKIDGFGGARLEGDDARGKPAVGNVFQEAIVLEGDLVGITDDRPVRAIKSGGTTVAARVEDVLPTRRAA